MPRYLCVQDGNSPLLAAANGGRMDVFRVLLAAGANKDAANKVRSATTSVSVRVRGAPHRTSPVTLGVSHLIAPTLANSALLTRTHTQSGAKPAAQRDCVYRCMLLSSASRSGFGQPGASMWRKGGL